MQDASCQTQKLDPVSTEFFCYGWQCSLGMAEHLKTKRRNPLLGYPILIGASRKSFLGEILSRGEHGRKTAPKERGWATAAAVACAVQQKSLVVRVHDTREMSDVVQISGAIWP